MEWISFAASVVVGLLALIGSVIGAKLSSDKTQALVLYRIDRLEEKVNKHNSVIERTAVLERDIKTVFGLIDDLKEDK